MLLNGWDSSFREGAWSLKEGMTIRLEDGDMNTDYTKLHRVLA